MKRFKAQINIVIEIHDDNADINDEVINQAVTELMEDMCLEESDLPLFSMGLNSVLVTSDGSEV
jgi:hypothetical protein